MTNVNDAGPGAFREAIQKANLNPGEDLIHFSFAGDPPHLIELQSPLPTITDPVRIEAAYEDLRSPRQIELSGAGAGPQANGLHLAVGDCQIRGLAIGGFDQHGILIESFGHHVIEGNFFGADANGNARGNIGAGIAVFDSIGNRIGGTNAHQANLISGNGTGILITGVGASGNVVQGNLVGPDLSGAAAIGNSQNGILIYNAAENTVGGSEFGAGNVISANAQSGVYIYGPDSIANRVLGNHIGSSEDGLSSLGNGFDGVTIFDAFENVIGGIGAGAGNLISGNGQRGVFITGEDASDNVVQGNHIGIDVTGTNEMGNGFSGVTIANVSSNRIGGAVDGARNIISGNKQSGVLLRGVTTSGNVIEGNYIGTDPTGGSAIRNLYNGIAILEAAGTVIGGASAGAGNVISGNGEAGVYIAEEGATGNILEGNFVGCDANGKKALPNGYAGVRLEYGGNRVGRAAGKPNVISGNTHSGIEIFGELSSSNVVQGNFIGTDATGKAALANAGGIAISGATDNLIGGTEAGAGNLISGNDDSGIFLVDAATSRNVIQGNQIGTDVTGAVALSNYGDGISIFDASENLIGGTNRSAPNIICANLQDGILIQGTNAFGNAVQGNLIGTAADGRTRLGNRLHGIELDGGAGGNVIGGALGSGNRIAFSQTAGAAGVRIQSGSRNAIRYNAIFSNKGLGIDLGKEGPDANDSSDTDDGANDLLNIPLITQAIGGAATELIGEYRGGAGLVLTLDFYVNSSANISGFGEGEQWVGFTNLVADDLGQASFDLSLSTNIAFGQWVTATATDEQGNTSEFSKAVRVGERDSDLDGLPDTYEMSHSLDPFRNSDAGSDPDQDGLTNLQEYFAGTDPHNWESALRLSAARTGPSTTRLEFEAVAGHQYRIESSEDLHGVWRALQEVHGQGARAVLFDNSGSARQRFYRVVVLP